MNSNFPDNKQQDAALRSALARRAGRCPQMPADLNERMMTRAEVQPKRTAHPFLWPWAAVAACVVAVFIGYTYIGDKTAEDHFVAQQTETSAETPNLIYASTDGKEQSVYRNPALVDEFIVKLAGYYGIEKEMFDSTSTADVTNYLYVFPDEMEIDVFGRLLQVACCYDNKSPGYQLHLSQSQFHFELNDIREGRHHMWMAEKIGNNTFLYGVNVPEGVIFSNASYTDYRDRHIVGNKKHTYYKL